jgi:hypothetical protein
VNSGFPPADHDAIEKIFSFKDFMYDIIGIEGTFSRKNKI